MSTALYNQSPVTAISDKNVMAIMKYRLMTKQMLANQRAPFKKMILTKPIRRKESMLKFNA